MLPNATANWLIMVRIGDRRTARDLETAATKHLHGCLVTRDGGDVYVRARNSRRRRQAESWLRRLLAQRGIYAQPVTQRWNPQIGDWQDPALPVGRAPTRQAKWIDLEGLRWEVRASFDRSAPARTAAERLLDEGEAVFWRGRCTLAIAVASEPEANDLADRIARNSAVASVHVRRLSRVRRWFMRQGLGGNYADEPRGRFGIFGSEAVGDGAESDSAGGDGGGGNGGG